jgi:hypothetical protein
MVKDGKAMGLSFLIPVEPPRIQNPAEPDTGARQSARHDPRERYALSTLASRQMQGERQGEQA